MPKKKMMKIRDLEDDKYDANSSYSNPIIYLQVIFYFTQISHRNGSIVLSIQGIGWDSLTISSISFNYRQYRLPLN